jgi:hypothetical protein
MSRLLIWPRGIWDVLSFAADARREWSRPAPVTAEPGFFRSMKMRKQDVRAVFRFMGQRPLFSAAVVMMLALGLGASTAMFSVVYGVLLKPLPFPEPERIVQVWGNFPARQLSNTSLTEANFWDMRDWNRAFEELGALHGASFTLTGEGMAPARASGARVSVGFFRALGVQPVAGRLFEPGEDEPGSVAERVLLSNDLWRQRFGGDRGIVGGTILLDNVPYQVVGVLPAGSPRPTSSSRSSGGRMRIGAVGSTWASAGSSGASRMRLPWPISSALRKSSKPAIRPTRGSARRWHRRASGWRAISSAGRCGFCWARSGSSCSSPA